MAPPEPAQAHRSDDPFGAHPRAVLLGTGRFRELLGALRDAPESDQAALLSCLASAHLGDWQSSQRHAARWAMGREGRHVDHGPLVSVVIPTHNRRDLLPRALDSVAAQLYRDLEVIVVNDAGEDVSDLVQQRRGDGRSWLHLRHERSQYLARARNSGLSRASGDYVLCLDDDDLLYPHHVGHLVASALSEESDLVSAVALRHRCGGGGESLEAWPAEPLALPALLRHNLAPVQAVLFRRALATRLGGFDGRLRAFEDWDFWLRCAAETSRVSCSRVPTSCVDQRHHQGRMSSGRAAGLVAHAAIERRHRALIEEHGGVAMGIQLRNNRRELRRAALAEASQRRVGLLIVEEPETGSWAKPLARALSPLTLASQHALPSDATLHRQTLMSVLGDRALDTLAIVHSSAVEKLRPRAIAQLAAHLDANPQVGAVSMRVTPPATSDELDYAGDTEVRDVRCLVVSLDQARRARYEPAPEAKPSSEQWRELLAALAEAGARVIEAGS